MVGFAIILLAQASWGLANPVLGKMKEETKREKNMKMNMRIKTKVKTKFRGRTKTKRKIEKP